MIKIVLFYFVVACLHTSVKSDLHEISNENIDNIDPRRKLFRPLQSRDLSNMIIDNDRKLIYVGAVNFLYAMDLDDISIKKAEIHWAPEPFQLQTCLNFKGDAARCQNSIRVLHSVNGTHLYACGTMAFSPTCTYIHKKDFQRAPGRGQRGKWRAPQDPLSATVSTMTEGALFTATSLASSMKNGVIAKTTSRGTPLRTNENDNFWLSDPHFVSSFSVPDERGQEKVIVLLKENAEEIPTEILTQDSDHSLGLVYSRVACVCANDRGGNLWVLKDNFATFTKMRIACPVKINRGRNRPTIPFFYDEIQSSYVIPNPEEPSNPTIYTIFTTPNGAFEATATCVFEMNDIRKYFSTNKYWNRPGKSSSSIYSTYDGPSSTAPGKCVPDTSTMSGKRLSFGGEHPIKYGIIKPKDESAIYQDTGTRYKHIVVDRITRRERQGSELVDRQYDVVHYISETGFMKRLVFFVEDRSQFWEIPSRNIFKDDEVSDTVTTIKIENGHFYIGTNASAIQLPVASCSMYKGCYDCKAANDPYCNWNDVEEKCELFDFNTPSKINLLILKDINPTSECRQGGELNADKKSGDNDDIYDKPNAEFDMIAEENVKLKFLNEEQNKSINLLEKKNSYLTAKLSESMYELSSLAKNYSQLSTLLLQYDARRKLVIQLYRNTVYSLHACQHEKTQTSRLLAQKKAALADQMRAEADRPSDGQKGVGANRSNRDCGRRTLEKMATDESESGIRRCDKEEEYASKIRELRHDMKVLEREKKTNVNTLASCLSGSSRLKQRIHLLDETKQNMTKEKTQLQKQMNQIKEENQRLKLSSALPERGCGETQWFAYEPTRKMYLLTRTSSNNAKAIKYCSTHNAVLATMKTDEEARYIYEIGQKFAPRKRYWIGLQKHSNGTMIWTDDGSTFNPYAARKFSKGQKGKLSNEGKYCVETTLRSNQWQLIPCNKARRVICMKDFVEVER
ncbi:semaphorin-3E-like [Styela clava]